MIFKHFIKILLTHLGTRNGYTYKSYVEAIFTDLNNLNGREILCYFIVNLSTTVCHHNLME